MTQKTSFLGLVPESIASDKNIKATAKAFDEQMQALMKRQSRVHLLSNIDNLSSIELDHLAVQYDLDVWRDSWPLSMKRNVLKTSIQIKRKKGTVAAVEDALSSIGSAASIVEWWQTNPKGKPHTFTIYATQAEFEGTITDEMQEDLVAMINDAKPLRSHYDLVIQHVAKGGIYLSGVARPVAFVKLTNF